MKTAFALLAALLVFLAVVSVAHAVEPFGPTELILWDNGKILNPFMEREKNSFRAEIGWHYFLLNNRPVQIGRPESASSAKHEFRFGVQFKLIEIPDWGKLEAYVASSFATNQDMPDRANVVAQVAYTIEDFRVEFGNTYALNVGAKQPGHGMSQTWAGLCYRAVDLKNFLVDGCGRYFLSANSPDTISNKVEVRNPAKYEVNAHVYYRIAAPAPMTFMLEPYGFINSGLDRGGVIGGVRWHVGELVPFLPRGLWVQPLGKIGTDGGRSEYFIGAGAGFVFE